ncbi:SGNH/GDSL hydrolase family protein [Aeromicrobium sp. A1-2]|uniref:SGNH/GDSL hydrolase family protein n=1 Tax=Aeromicrobium sp. A1-2 TaxID=2107713 RepID=UPI0013C2D7EB|nr:SGNH/GDSL hydrolase family protein [Aeromicrobium sp. A1-2]
MALAMATMSIGLTGTTAQAGTGHHGSHHGSSHATGWYVALGDSLAAGYQPNAGDDKTGGYVGAVLAAEKRTARKTKLRNLACSGETSTTLVDGGRCDYVKGNQLDQALAFMRAHRRTTSLVTMTIGANDVTPCLRATDQNACIQERLAVLGANLHTSLAKIHAAAPDARIVVTNYYNPYLALYFTNPALAQQTSGLQMALNSTIATVTAPYGTTVDVASAFQSYDTTVVGGVPTNVSRICTLTWMCSLNDIHANDDGYALIGATVAAALPRARGHRH